MQDNKIYKLFKIKIYQYILKIYNYIKYNLTIYYKLLEQLLLKNVKNIRKTHAISRTFQVL